MKKYLLFLLITCQSYAVLAQDNKTPYMTKSLSGSAIKSVFVRTSGGSIAVSGGGENARVEVYINGTNGNGDISNDEIKKRLADYVLEVTADNGEVHAVAKPKTKGFFN